MSRAVRLVSAPWRLARAMRREGVGPVLDFLKLTLRRRGLRNAMRLGLTDADHRQADAAVYEQDAIEATLSARRGPSRPTDLDARYTLSVKDWARWAPVLGAPPPSADPRDDLGVPAIVRFVIRGAADDPKAAAATRQAIARLRDADAAEWIAPPEGDALSAEAFVVFLRAGDIPSSLLPGEIARAAHGGRAEVVSFDMVRATHDETGARMQPLLFPGANPTLLREADYLFSRVALRGAVLPTDHDLAVADPRALILAWLDTVDVNAARGRWRHVGRPLVQAAIDDAEVERVRETALARGRRPLTSRGGDVTVVICTKDKGHLTRQLVRTLLAGSAKTVAEVVIVSNDTTNRYALQTLKDLAQDPRVQVINQNGPFNFSKMSNTGARMGIEGRHLLFLNDDITPVGEEWLERLVARLERRDVGAVGPLLLYPDERVQHAGMYTGFKGAAGHTLRGARLPDEDYLLTCVAAREVSCLTGAALLTPRAAFEAMNGFDEQLATYLQDVDYGLRLHRSGWVNIFEPASVMIHMESASIGAIERTPAFHRRREAEYARFAQRWSAEGLDRDVLHAPGFAKSDESLRTLAPVEHLTYPN